MYFGDGLNTLMRYIIIKSEFNIFPEKVKWQPHLAFISLPYSRWV